MNKLKMYVEKPVIGPLIKEVMKIVINQKVRNVARNFDTYMQPLIANDPLLCNESYKIRNDVYCEELKFLNTGCNGLEIDDFDKHSIHCLIKHLPTGKFPGTIRVVRPEINKHSIPLQKRCADSIFKNKINPADFPPHEICEISRLAVSREFRKREVRNDLNIKSPINYPIYSEKEMGYFPFIAIILYLSAAAVVIENGIQHTFVMMEPRLARSMGSIGIQFEQIGPAIDYHGQRAPYYINPSLLMENLTPSFQMMLKTINSYLKYKG